MQSPTVSDWDESSTDTCCADSVWCDLWHSKGVWAQKNQNLAYKFKQEGVLSECSDAAGKTQDEHNASDDDEEPHGVEAPQVCDRGQVWQNTLEGKKKEGLFSVYEEVKITFFGI